MTTIYPGRSGSPITLGRVSGEPSDRQAQPNRAVPSQKHVQQFRETLGRTTLRGDRLELLDEKTLQRRVDRVAQGARVDISPN
jgi:hypothetical protein